MQEKIKHLKEMKIITFNLSSGCSPESDQNSDLKSELELELLGAKPNIEYWTLPPSHLSRLRSGW